MSAIASFYVMERAKFEEYCAMADLHLIGSTLTKADDDQKAEEHKVLMAVTRDMMNSPAFKARMKDYKKIYNFLVQNSKEPYLYNWSGYVMAELLAFLKDEKQIDLMAKTYQDREGESQRHLLDSELKEKYLNKLDPAKFSENEIASEYMHAAEQYREEILKKMAAAMPPEKMKEIMAMQSTMPPAEDFPERGKAMMDGIKIVHDCLKLVTESTVVMISIG
ncbi:MAG TPA: hypothetical protein V6C89_10690 [Drouetiella sp.]|jgi:hypothetical protein